MSVLCIAESFTCLTGIINTASREKIYLRWCCIDRLSWHRLSGTTGDVARDLLILTVELPGKSSDNSCLRRNSMKPCIELTVWRGRGTRRVSNRFGIDGGVSNENGDSMFLLVARGVFIGAAAARRQPRAGRPFPRSGHRRGAAGSMRQFV